MLLFEFQRGGVRPPKHPLGAQLNMTYALYFALIIIKYTRVFFFRTLNSNLRRKKAQKLVVSSQKYLFKHSKPNLQIDKNAGDE